MPWIPVFRYLIPDLLSSELVFRIPMPRIPDSTSTNICSDYGFHTQNFHGFRMPLQGAKRERLSKPVLYSEPLDISRTATPTAKVASIWTSSICQMQATFPGAEFLRILFRFKKRKENSSSYVHVLHKTAN